MKDHYSRAIEDFQKIASDLNETIPKVTSFVDGCCDALRKLIFWDTGWVEDRRADAHAKTAELQDSAQKFTTKCDEDCSTVILCDTLTRFAEVYKNIDFDDLLGQVDRETMIGNRGDWQSDNEPLYEAKIEQIKPKVEDFKKAVQTLVQGVERIDAAEDSYVTNLLMAVGGVAIAFGGFLFALATGFTGVGAIIGVIFAAAGLIHSIVSVLMIPNIAEEVKNQASLVEQEIAAVNNSPWPSETSFNYRNW